MTISPSTRSRVVPGLGETIARSRPRSAFRRLDFPTFGAPGEHHRQSPVDDPPAPCARQQTRKPARDLFAPHLGIGTRPSDRVLGEVERHLEAGHQVEEEIPQRAHFARQGPVHLPHRQSSRALGSGTDQQGHRLGLDAGPGAR